jgi:preprotein translocase subunit SecF
MKFRSLFLVISLSLIFVSLFSIIKWNFRKSIDFTGGTIWQFQLEKSSSDKVKDVFSLDSSVNVQDITLDGSTYHLKTSPVNQEQKVKFTQEFIKLDPKFKELKFESLGPSMGRELLIKTIVAIVLSSIALLIFIGSRFSDISFGAGAVLAMFHDAFILIGSFSLLGHFFGAEIDTLFVTALLTTLSASVHDTVVTFDRIRELKRKYFGQDWVTLANQAITETIVRSINNSMTIIFMLLALVLLGGDTTRWFAAALLIGVVMGTYSSTAVAIPLVLFFKRKKK